MTLTAKDVAEITRLLEESSFDEMELELEGLKLSFRRSGRADPQQHAVAPSSAQGAAEPASAPEPEAPSPSSAPRPSGAPADHSLHEIVAPLLGTFYRAPKPGAPPFIEIGSQVEEESVIGIIEVMKLMTSVRSGVRGEVREIVALDGALVEYGQPLVRVRTAG